MIVKKLLRKEGVTLVAEARLLLAKELLARVVDCRSMCRDGDITMVAKRSTRWLLS